MSVGRIYLDYNASAPLLAEARDAMLAALAVDCGNPSSVHAEGRKLRGMIEAARDQVAALVGARPADVVFTSGATEANVTALSRGLDTIFVSGIEHDSVLAPVATSGARVIDLPVTRQGVVDVAAFKDLARAQSVGRAVVAVQMANNETGVLQPVAELAAFARDNGIVCHSDAVQAVGRVAIDFATLGVASLAMSAHKLGGPKGVGALLIQEGSPIASLISGGGQERRRRAGTENVVALAGFGAAAQVARDRLKTFSNLEKLRDRLEMGLLQASPDAVIFGKDAQRLANTCCVGVSGHMSEIGVIKFDLAGFAVSAGSACSSGKVGASRVLAAMKADLDSARGAIRVSLGPDTAQSDIDAFLNVWREIYVAAGDRHYQSAPRIALVTT